jgi:hypothetical protein
MKFVAAKKVRQQFFLFTPLFVVVRSGIWDLKKKIRTPDPRQKSRIRNTRISDQVHVGLDNKVTKCQYISVWLNFQWLFLDTF